MFVLGSRVVLAAETKTAADFFKGATIRIIVPFAPGGTGDTCARVPALFFGKYTGARVVVENMPGAGGYVGLRYLYTARPDGLTLGLTNPTGAFMAEELGQKEVTWQLDKFEHIARVLRGSGGILMVGKQSSIRTLEDLLKTKKEMRAASIDPTVGASINAVLAAEALGLNLKIVTGFPGGRACILAVMKGEIEMTVNPPAGFEDDFKKGELRAIAIAAGREIAPIFRPIFASVPRLLDLPLPQEKKRYLELSASLNEIGFPLSGPPNVPKERVQFLERAWLKALGEPEVKKTLETRGDFYAPLTGAEYLQILKGLKKVVADIGAKNVNHILFEKYY
jgi:tripartite-type tricarboxylate transporter receptor subunit TctC